MKLKTVKIRRGEGSCLINERDFDPDKHELYEAEKSDKKPESSGTDSGEVKESAPKRAAVRKRAATKK